jgi:hypothetical protein
MEVARSYAQVSMRVEVSRARHFMNFRIEIWCGYFRITDRSVLCSAVITSSPAVDAASLN